MDKAILIVGVIAIVAILTVTLVLNPFGGNTTETKKTSEQSDTKETSDTTSEKPSDTMATESQNEGHLTTPEDNIDYDTATYGKMLGDVGGDCTLYQNIRTERFQCFGLAGNFSTIATNEYHVAESEDYFCKGTVYGCKVYQKVDFQ